MNRYLLLDSAPLGLITHPQRSARVAAITEWLYLCITGGDWIVVPAIAYYELKRELIRAGKTAGITRLDAFVRATPGRYLPVSDEALRLAAGLWAAARRQGKPTAGPNALDIDVILAAQALSFGPSASEVTIVTTNAKHLSQFVPAKDWSEVIP